jgi:hypothetical protein
MKTNSKTLLAGTAAIMAAAAFASLSFAGPDPQSWQQQEKLRAESAAKAQVNATAKTPAMSCASCKTTPVQEFVPAKFGGKYAKRSVTVGSKHECGACDGAITTVRGQTTNDMKANCPTCAHAKAAAIACCTTN